MQQLDRIQSRRRGLIELGELMRALRVLAAAHLAEAQAALPAALAYRQTLREAWAALPEAAPEVAEGAALQLLLGAEHGFTGAYSERLLAASQPELPLALVGRRAHARAVERKRDCVWNEEFSTRPATVPDLARRLAARVRDWPGPVTLIHAVYRHGSRFELGRGPLWPLPVATATAPAGPPRTQLPTTELRAGVAGALLVAELSVALLEALASENAARMTVLDAAEHTLEGKLTTLKVEERSARQGAITAELLDVVTGAEAQRR
ncbi:MAG: F0F1 ATP synthase subunit gamma [Xanthomonadales bacterium]|jgi:F-type H+-transporting ATPase subunit gamma|nr:F0F1 ATP synthase subunit gamma [Xanthomonadales bacterium]